jgi:hypothetical protein
MGTPDTTTTPPDTTTTPNDQTADAHATPTAGDQPVSDAERNPARDQAPVATDRMEAIVGDPGFREQQPPVGFADANTPLSSSAPPPAAQSGVPLAEDRAAGVRPGPSGPIPGPGQPVPDAASAPVNDGSEGSTSTPPRGS